jgi:hypothetical protein
VIGCPLHAETSARASRIACERVPHGSTSGPLGSVARRGERFWIAEIQISEEMEAKIRRRRFVTGDEVRAACVPDAYDRAGWEDDEEHGRRLLVVCRTAQGRRLKADLQPIDVHEGIWRLRTVLLDRGGS